MYAVIETGGKQHRVSPGEKFKAEKLDASVGEVVRLDKVLVIGGEAGEVMHGTPYLPGVYVGARVLQQGRDRKVTVFKYKPKKRYRIKRGHRQCFTLLQVEEIDLGKLGRITVAAAEVGKATKMLPEESGPQDSPVGSSEEPFAPASIEEAPEVGQDKLQEG